MLKNELRDILAQKKADDTSDWLECITLRQEDHTLLVGFPHSYFAAWFVQHKLAIFEEAIFCRFGDGQQPQIIYDRPVLKTASGQLPVEGQQKNFTEKASAKKATEADVAHAGVSATTTATTHRKPGGDAFAAFIANAKNAFPLAAAKEIAEHHSGEAYNPFLICGKSGTGKSHILRAMATTMQDGLEKRVIFAPAARFCADNPAWARRPEIFWQQYDALMLDDIQDLAGQGAWQKKLIACMDACPRPHETKMQGAGQMVFACSGQPQALKTLDERLRSRLESGLVVELMEPDLDVRMRYLQSMSKDRKLNLSRDQLLFIAQRCPQFRLLQGLLLKVAAFCSVTGCELSQTDLENIVRTGVADKTPGCLEILGEVARDMNLRPEDVLGGKRRPDLVLARQLSMYICRQKLGLSYPELGRAFGGKDHSTVIHAIKKIKKLLVSDKALQQLVTKLEIKTQ